MKDVEYDILSITEEPIFLQEDDDSISMASELIHLGKFDSLSSRHSSGLSSVVALYGEDAG